jgi:hypothetical protein
MASCGLERLLLRTLINSSNKNFKKERKSQAPIATDSPLMLLWNEEEIKIRGIEGITNTGERIEKNME